MANYFTEFIPEVWSGSILMAKDKVHVFGALANRNYEGDIRGYGDTVKINSIGDVTVNDYTRNNFGTGLTIQYMDTNQITMLIDQAKYFTVAVDRVDEAQMYPKVMGAISQKAAYSIADTQDSYIAGLYTFAGITSTSNTAAAPVTLTSTNIEDELLLMGQEFDEANCQRQGRYIVIPPVAMKGLVKAGVVTKTDNVSDWTNGFVGRAYGWDIYMSNNVSQTSTGLYRMICGIQGESLTMAEQVTELKMVDMALSLKGFGNAITGLHVYGARAIPDRTGVLYANIS